MGRLQSYCLSSMTQCVLSALYTLGFNLDTFSFLPISDRHTLPFCQYDWLSPCPGKKILHSPEKFLTSVTRTSSWPPEEGPCGDAKGLVGPLVPESYPFDLEKVYNCEGTAPI